jgi:hypothetical protein
VVGCWWLAILRHWQPLSTQGLPDGNTGATDLWCAGMKLASRWLTVGLAACWAAAACTAADEVDLVECMLKFSIHPLLLPGACRAAQRMAGAPARAWAA